MKVLLGFLICFVLSKDAFSASDCGAKYLLTEPGDVLKSHTSGNQYKNNVKCNWKIRAPVGLQIKVQFLDFQVEQDVKCRADALVFKTDSWPSSRTLFTLCGTKPLRIFLSPSNTLFVSWSTDQSGTGRGWQFRFSFIDSSGAEVCSRKQITCGTPQRCVSRAVLCDGREDCSDGADEKNCFDRNSGCGTKLMQQSGGLFASMNYGKTYANNALCLWRLDAGQGKVIQIRFSDGFFIARSRHNPSLCSDSLSIVETKSQKVLYKGCGRERPPSLVSSSSAVHVKFETDDLDTAEGFRAFWLAKNDSGCGNIKQQTGPNGSLSTQNYPKPYGENLVCQWTITVKPNEVIDMEFQKEYQVGRAGSEKNCTEFTFIIDSILGNTLLKHCGHKPPPKTFSSGNKVTVVFISEKAKNNTGFQLNWSARSKSTTTTRKQALTVTVQPQPTVVSSIVVPTKFATPTKLAFKHHTKTTPNYRLNSTSRNNFTEPTATVFINLTTMHSTMTYTKNISTQLPVELSTFPANSSRNTTRPTGSMPFRPSTLHPLIPTKPSKAVSTFSAYQTVSMDHSNIPTKIPTKIPTTKSTSSTFMPTIVPSKFPTRLTKQSSTGSTKLTSIQKPSLEITAIPTFKTERPTWNAIHRTTTTLNTIRHPSNVFYKCKATITTPSTGYILSHGLYGLTAYPDSFLCEWKITAPNGKVVALTVEEIDIEISNGCNTDYIKVYDGPNQWAPILEVLCGSRKPSTMETSGRTLLIRFLTNSYLGGKGFRLRYQFVDKSVTTTAPTAGSCGQNVRIQSARTLSSLRYDGRTEYPVNLDCTWIITAPAGKIIKLELIQFHLEYEPSCKYDYLGLFDGPDVMSKPLDVFCGEMKPRVITSEGRHLFLHFHTDENKGNIGFKFRILFVDPPQRCASNEFTCDNKRCIPFSAWCDKTDHCGDNSDERGCYLGKSSCGMPATQPIGLRVVNGQEARRGSWPWVAALYLRGTHSCGGALIAPQWIVSASHCFERGKDDPDTWGVALNKHNKHISEKDQIISEVEKVIMHEKYDPVSVINDIALLKLKKPVKISTNVRPLCLPTHSPVFGKDCYVTGWGDTQGTGDSSVLRQGVVPIIQTSTCKRSDWHGRGMEAGMFCAGYESGKKDACAGDSGGPLNCKVNGRWELQGIVSWGIGCGNHKSPGVYTDVLLFNQWILEKMSKN